MNEPIISRLTQAKALLAATGYQFSDVGGTPTINGKLINEAMKLALRASLIGSGEFSRCEAVKLVEEMGGLPMVHS